MRWNEKYDLFTNGALKKFTMQTIHLLEVIQHLKMYH